MWIEMAASALATQATSAQPPTVAASVVVSPAMATAVANKARMKVRPEVKSAPEPEYPNTEKAARHAGTVVVQGIVGTDGHFTELSVMRSSAGPVLEASMLAAARATIFSPAKDANGVPISVPISFPHSFTFDDVDPDYVTYVDADFTDTEKAAGHHGKVQIDGTIGSDGKIVVPVVAVSSRAPELDKAALAAAKATVFRVVKDSAGKPMPVPLHTAYQFVNYRSPGKGGGVLRYKCDQFARDQIWWRATWPEKDTDEFYAMMLGVGVLARMQLGSLNVANIKSNNDDFKARWTQAIEACRAKPDALFIDVFKPEGDWARRMAEKSR